MRRLRLMIPGPIELDPKVLAIMSEPLVAHYGEEWTAFYKETTGLLQKIFQTGGDVFLLPGSGSAALDAALGSTLFPDGKVLIPQNGFFGERLEEIARSYTPNVYTIKFPIGQSIDLGAVEKTLQTGHFDVVACVHCETSTGVVNDIKKLAEITRKYDAILVVDAISGLLADEFRMDEWGVDVVVSGSQKGLMLPPGLSFISFSQKAWEMVENSRLPKFYWDVRTYRKYLRDNKQIPYTPGVNLLFSLREALNMMREEGLENVFARHAELARATRRGVHALGLQLFAEQPCNAVTSVKVPEGIDGQALVKRMRLELGVSIAGGQREYKGKIFRIAHLGYMTRFDVILALSGLEIMLNKLGYKVESGKGVAEAEKEFMEAK